MKLTKSVYCLHYTSLLLLTLIFVPVSSPYAQDCIFDPLQPLTIPIASTEIRSSEIVNASFESVGPDAMYGRSLLLGINSAVLPQIAIINLDRRNDYPPMLIPEYQIKEFDIPGLSGMTIVEREIGAQSETNLHPDLLNFIGNPLVLLTDGTGTLHIKTLSDSTVLGPFTQLDMGLPAGWTPSSITFDNDMLRLFMFSSDPPEMYVLDCPFVNDGTAPMLIAGPVDLAPLIGYNEILDADFVEGINQLQLLLDSPREIKVLDVNDMISPIPVYTAPIELNMLTASVSQGWCNLSEGFGQVVGVTTNSLGDLECVATPCMPGPPPCLLQFTPIWGTYLEPWVGLSMAVDPRVSNNGALELRGSIEGPWWPTMMHGLAGPSPMAMTEFALDTSGAASFELTNVPSWMDGDGWRVVYDPMNPVEEATYLNLCFDFFPHEMSLCTETSIMIQDNFEPEFLWPVINGIVMRTDTIPFDSCEMEYPDPERVERTVVERDMVENEVAEDIDPIPQRRSGLPKFRKIIRDSLGNPIDTIYIEGGVYCAPTAAIQNLLAMARNNPCLCRLINCYLGNGPSDDCDSFTEEELTELIRTMGIAANTDPQTGSEYGDAVKGLEKFLKILVAESGACAGNCDHNIYGHFIPCGEDGESPKWEDIYEEMHTKKQTIMLRLLEVGPDGEKYEHRVSITDIYDETNGEVEICIADPWTGNYEFMKINTTTVPPTIIDDDPDPPNWQKITGAIAISDSTPQSDRSSLDEEYLDWELVLDEPGPIPFFTLVDLTPGQWLYRVKVHTFGGDSAMAYRLFYITAPEDLTATRVGDELHLSWQGDPKALDYTIMYTDDLDVDFQPLTSTPDTFFVVDYNEAEQRFFYVITNFNSP